MKHFNLTFIALIFSLASYAIGPISGTLAVCPGTTTTLTDTTSGGVWSSSNAAIATVASTSGVVTGLAAGAVTITYTVAGSFVTASVTLSPNPAIYAVGSLGSGTYCTGTPGGGVDIQLSGSDTGVSYQLYSGSAIAGSPLAGTGGLLDFGYQTSGTYIVIATSTGTSCTATMADSAVITRSAPPVVFTVTGGGTACIDSPYIRVGLNASQLGVNYELVDTVAIGSMAGSGSALDFGIQANSGSYIIVAADPLTGCTDTMTGSALITLLPCATGVGTVNLLDKTIRLFPNPAGDVCTVSCPFAPGDNAVVFICDIMGRQVHAYSLSGNSTVVSITDLSPGIYYCRIAINGIALQSEKLVVLR